MAGIRNLEVTVHEDGLKFSAYPASWPSRASLTRVAPREIELVFRGITEFQVLLRNGEVLLFPLEKALALREFALHHAIPTVQGTDPWTLLCDPFLDTEFTAEDDRLTTQRLGELGFDVEEIRSIRARVGPRLDRYVFHTWEWQILGLLEVLTTADDGSGEFFAWVCSICRRGYAHARALDLFEPSSPDTRRRRLDGEIETLWHRPEFRNPPAAGSARTRWWHFGMKKKSVQIDMTVDARMAQFRRLQQVSGWLLQQYGEPHRRYHDVDHVLQVMSLLNSLQPAAGTAALIAGLFHDAIYQPRSHSNEKRSAAAMRERLAELGLPSQLLERAAHLILYTRKHLPTDDPEEQAIHDADLGVFGQQRGSYEAYAAGIRAEYAHVPAILFRPGRRKILQEMLERAQRGRFYYLLDPIFERRVTDNLQWELATLQDARDR